MCGRSLRRLPVEGSRHPTPMGRPLLPVLLGFRLVLLAASGTGVYGDELSGLVCHTQQLGRKAACYDAFHPLSPLRFWAFQVTLVAVPSALYMGFTLYHVIWHWGESEKVKKEEETLTRRGEKSRDALGPGSPRVLWAYVAQLGLRLALERAALGGQYHLYGFKMPSSSVRRREPCLGSRSGNLSRPSEKTIFPKTTFGVTGLCLLFTLWELVLLGPGRWWKIWKHKSPSSNYFPTSESAQRHKEPTDNVPVVEIKGRFGEAGERGTDVPLSTRP
ncbi:LOW QUALITY PROTEIN: gap junction gamma-3 protein [Physeter macrocephalus]|uniref:LOW QUALITY PROTEIN: gap junction gamma-3 protein n=1 Tax=Physeter macrocephalus TaxID=9755 RepID=A0A2Y9FUX4_PHYMC|nr:LOW QUALITY PROTEIN: gap junction gamma-3 protein [Physeter catodon]|eukprot:XP_007131092.1 LOW QUALITY PROTEIN: gap junction gamma-3 protein [Physeter catodon]